jgi:large subunit ribosomal protein L25
MSTHLKITAQPRKAVGRTAVRAMKSTGFIPGNIYGAKVDAQALQFALRDVDYLLSHAASESVLVEVEIKDGAKSQTRTAFLQEVQHDPVSGKVLHLDLHAVAMDEVLTADVPIEGVGEAAGVKTGGGVLQQSLRTLEVECLPTNLPDSIIVDISKLEIGSSIHVRDIKLPTGVKLMSDADLTVFLVAAPKVEEEPSTLEPAITEPEVINEKKPVADEPEAK